MHILYGQHIKAHITNYRQRKTCCPQESKSLHWSANFNTMQPAYTFACTTKPKPFSPHEPPFKVVHWRAKGPHWLEKHIPMPLPWQLLFLSGRCIPLRGHNTSKLTSQTTDTPKIVFTEEQGSTLVGKLNTVRVAATGMQENRKSLSNASRHLLSTHGWLSRQSHNMLSLQHHESPW